MLQNHTIESREAAYIRFLKSEHFVMIVLVCISIPMMVHTAHLLVSVSSVKSYWYAYFYAAGFDTAMFLFAIKGRKNFAVTMGGILFLTNLAFFNLDLFGRYLSADGIQLAVTTIISLTSPIILHSFVSFFAEKLANTNRVMELHTANYALEKEKNQLKEQIKAMLEEMNNLKTDIDKARLESANRSTIDDPKLQTTSDDDAAKVQLKTITSPNGKLQCNLCKIEFTNSAHENYTRRKCPNQCLTEQPISEAENTMIIPFAKFSVKS